MTSQNTESMRSRMLYRSDGAMTRDMRCARRPMWGCDAGEGLQRVRIGKALGLDGALPISRFRTAGPGSNRDGLSDDYPRGFIGLHVYEPPCRRNAWGRWSRRVRRVFCALGRVISAASLALSDGARPISVSAYVVCRTSVCENAHRLGGFRMPSALVAASNDRATRPGR